jgi:hypothetical protein
VPHHKYWCLGNDAAKRQAEIRESNHKSWVLGSDKFKTKIENPPVVQPPQNSEAAIKNHSSFRKIKSTGSLSMCSNSS